MRAQIEKIKSETGRAKMMLSQNLEEHQGVSLKQLISILENMMPKLSDVVQKLYSVKQDILAERAILIQGEVKSVVSEYYSKS